MSTYTMSRSNIYAFIFALVLGVILAVSASVWATSVGTNVTVTGTLAVQSSTASSSVTQALGVGTTTPAIQLSVGGAAGNSTGHGYFTGGLGVGAISTTAGRLVANVAIGVASTTPAQELSVVGDGYFTGGLGAGIATTTAGAIENTGNALFGNAAADLVMFNSASVIFNNKGTTTIPSSDADAWNIATSSANIQFVKYDTSNYRIGIGTSTPATTLSVGGAGHIYALGGIGVGTATTTAGAIENTGNALFGNAAADQVMFNAATHVYNNQGTSTIPSSNADAWSFATSTASIPLLKLDTSNTRVGISTTTPGGALAVGGTGQVVIVGDATSSVSVQSTGSFGGCIELMTTDGASVVSLMATSSDNTVYWTAGGCR